MRGVAVNPISSVQQIQVEFCDYVLRILSNFVDFERDAKNTPRPPRPLCVALCCQNAGRGHSIAGHGEIHARRRHFHRFPPNGIRRQPLAADNPERVLVMMPPIRVIPSAVRCPSRHPKAPWSDGDCYANGDFARFAAATFCALRRVRSSPCRGTFTAAGRAAGSCPWQVWAPRR